VVSGLSTLPTGVGFQGPAPRTQLVRPRHVSTRLSCTIMRCREGGLGGLALPQFGACGDPVFLACSHSSHQVSMLPGCGFVRAVLVAVLCGQLENVAVRPSFQSCISKRWGVVSVVAVLRECWQPLNLNPKP
jgi:hypothetical protein